MSNKIVINIDELRRGSNRPIYLNSVRDAVFNFADGCSAVKNVYNDTNVMVISGPITEDDVIRIFNDEIGVFVEPMIMTVDDWTSSFNDAVEVLENKNNKNRNKNKKRGCCPPPKKEKRVFEGKWYPLKEMLAGANINENASPDYTVNDVIDILSGQTRTGSLMEKAIQKAQRENKDNVIIEKLGRPLYKRIMESLNSGKKCLHGECTINGKKIKECGLEELQSYKDKVDECIEKLNKKITGVNECEELNSLKEKLNKSQRLQTVLEEEIAYREARNKKLTEGESEEDDVDSAVEFKNLNPNSDSDKNSDSDSDDEENPDEDELVELSSIVITLSNEEAANDLKNELIEAGVPDEAIEVASESGEEESDEDSEDSDEDGGVDSLDDMLDASDENDSDSAEQAESVKTKGEKSLNEDESEEETSDDADEEPADDANDDAESSDEESEDEKKYTLTLVDTDYADILKDVLINKWGFTEEEFAEMVGGDIVSNPDEDPEESSEESDSSENDDNDASSDSEDDDMEDFDPDLIFKDM